MAPTTDRNHKLSVTKFRAIYTALGLYNNKYLPSAGSETKGALIMKSYQGISEALESRASKLDRKYMTPKDSGKGVNVTGAAELVRKRREFAETIITIKLPRELITADDFPSAKGGADDDETADDRKNRQANAALKVDLGPLYDWTKDRSGKKDMEDQTLAEDELAALDVLVGENTDAAPAEVDATHGTEATTGDASAEIATGPKLVKETPAAAAPGEPAVSTED